MRMAWLLFVLATHWNNTCAMDRMYKTGLALAKTMPMAPASTSDLVSVISPAKTRETPWGSGTLWENWKE